MNRVKKLLQNKTFLLITSMILVLVVLPVVIFLGFQYLFPVAIIALAYLFIYKVKYEDIISPREFDEMKLYLKELEEQAFMIEEHLKQYDEDLQAKFELREIKKEIELVKKEMGL